ncbi:MAG: hypothetical protein FJ280_09235 [Planctomycetes bacterium]|nr:hypothetical protein [Planctomycetota bacterium]
MSSRRNGSVLVVLVLVSAVLAALGASMLSVGYHARTRASRLADDMAARVAADAGLTKAMHTLSTQFDAGTLNPAALPGETNASLPHFEGTFTYTIAAGPPGSYTLTSVGSFHNAQRTVEAVMRSGGMVHQYAVFALQSLVLNNSAKINWYNNQPGDAPLQIGTNSTGAGAIKLNNSAYINGDVVVGAGGNPASVIQNNHGVYTGWAYAQSQNQEAPSVSVPAALVTGPSSGPIDNTRTISTSGKYTKIDLGNSKRLTISGNVELYIAGTVTLGNSAEIRVNEGGSLVLYANGNVTANNSSKFDNRTNDATKLRILGTGNCTKITLHNSGNMYGVVYAPQAALILHNSATVRGAITARTCELNNSATLYYDASLRAKPDPALAGGLELASWREF